MNASLRSLAGFAAGLLTVFPCLSSLAHAAPAAAPTAAAQPASTANTVAIPGPLRSFLRMAGISQEAPTDQVLPLLAGNVFLHGYSDGRQTEYLVLLDRYLELARQVQQLAGPDGVIRIAGCADAERLVEVLGYGFAHGCSRADPTLVTQNARRAFLTIDSGFPITDLEEAIAKGTPFVYPFPSTRVPVLFTEADWKALTDIQQSSGVDLLDILLRDPKVARLYAGMARVEPHTRQVLLKTTGLHRLLPLANSFDFYGSQIYVPGDTVVVPGGKPAEKAWQSLAGASPHDVANFTGHVMGRDRNWLAAYFDALSRLTPEQQSHLLPGSRLRNLYFAYRATGATIYAASGVFPRNAELVLLLSRIRWQSNGEPEIPGGLKMWQEAFRLEKSSFGYRDWSRHFRHIGSPERFLEALVAATNMVSETGPEQTYLAVAGIQDSHGAQKLSDATLRLLADNYPDYCAWYPLLNEFSELNDASIAEFFNIAHRITAISSPGLRANALGAVQADIGIWQILARQQEIPSAALNASWMAALEPFGQVTSSNQLFTAARASLAAVVTAAGGSPNLTQEEVVNLLAGPRQATPVGQRVHEQMAARISAVLSDQQLVSLDTLLPLYDGLESMAHGAALGNTLLPLAEDLHGFEMPRPVFSGTERAAWSPIIYTSRHAELQVRTDLSRILRGAHSPQQLEEAQARLAPFLRDTLVGLNYAYYEPPGAQVLHQNPLFVRSHDFSVESVQGMEHVWGSPELIGIGATAGGGAYLMGSLAGLPYALASTEEDFIAPTNVQALIWREAVPELLVSSVVPRWWKISSEEMHAAALYQRAGEELVRDAESDAQERAIVEAILADRFPVGRMGALDEALQAPATHSQALSLLLPSDMFFLEARARRFYPAVAAQSGPAGKELDELVRSDPGETTPQRLAADFGVPHPSFDDSNACSLLQREFFTAAGGFTSRLFGESWESNNLYWARLADRMGYQPVMLNLLVPDLTGSMVANIFATYVDDWPALQRAMERTGEEFRQGKFNAQFAGLDNAGSGANRSASE